MGLRNVMILFFSTMAVSLVVLILFFSLFFQNMDPSFDTHMPETAPEILKYAEKKGGGLFGGGGHSTVNVPQDLNGGSNADSVSGAVVGAGAESSTLSTLVDENKAAEAAEDGEEAPEIQEPTEPADAEPKPTDNATSPAGHHQENIPPVPPAPITDTKKPAEPATPAEEKKPTDTTSKPSGNTKYQVYLDGFKSPDDARATAEKLQAQGQSAIVKQSGGRTVVQLGTFSKKEYADDLSSRTGAKVKPAP